MSISGSYVVRLLRSAEQRLGERGDLHAQSVMGRIVARFSRSDNVHEELKRLYYVNGMDRLALRLMWSLERLPSVSRPAEQVFLRRESDRVCSEFLRVFHGPGELPSDDLSADLLSALNEVSARVDNLKGPEGEESLGGTGEQKLFGVLQSIEALQTLAAQQRKQRVLQFAIVFKNFLRFVLDRKMFSDVRLVHILEHANNSLHTILLESREEGQDTLQETTDLLKDPETLLD
jgi:hypothetical protein